MTEEKSKVLKNQKLLVLGVRFDNSAVLLKCKNSETGAIYNNLVITSAYNRHFGRKYTAIARRALLETVPKNGLAATLLPKTAFREYGKTKVEYRVAFDKGPLDEWIQDAAATLAPNF